WTGARRRSASACSRTRPSCSPSSRSCARSRPSCTSEHRPPRSSRYTPPVQDDIDSVSREISAALPVVEKLTAEIRKRVVGQARLVERLVIGLLTGGHVLLEGVPGLAKK